MSKISKVNIKGGAVFERYEKKFLLSQKQYKLLRQAFESKMQDDEYGLHTIFSIYFDTDDYSVIRRCMEKPKFKQRLRLRSYGVPALDTTVYLELKKKMHHVTYKRRIPLSFRDAMSYMENGALPSSNTQISDEIDWYKKQYDVKPKVLICYDRIATYGKNDNQLRITFDKNVRWRDYDLRMDNGDYGKHLLPAGTRMMEIKTLRSFPLWLTEILSYYKIYPISFSKYANVYKQCISEGEVILNVG